MQDNASVVSHMSMQCLTTQCLNRVHWDFLKDSPEIHIEIHQSINIRMIQICAKKKYIQHLIPAYVDHQAHLLILHLVVLLLLKAHRFNLAEKV